MIGNDMELKGKLSDYDIQDEIDDIEDYDDLVQYLYDESAYEIQETFTLNEYGKLIDYAILSYIYYYKKEGEVLLLNKELNVPRNSILLLNVSRINSYNPKHNKIDLLENEDYIIKKYNMDSNYMYKPNSTYYKDIVNLFKYQKLTEKL
jgi:hypothetical protein